MRCDGWRGCGKYLETSAGPLDGAMQITSNRARMKWDGRISFVPWMQWGDGSLQSRAEGFESPNGSDRNRRLCMVQNEA